MKKMGWTGGGLGKREQGRKEPVESGKAGKSRINDGETKKKKASPYVGVVVDDEVRFGKMVQEGLQEYVPTTKGHMRKGEKVWTVDKLPQYELRPEQIMETVEWGGRPVGIAENFFPDPQGWRLRGVDVGLDRVRVKLLTSAMAGMMHVQPACKWHTRLLARSRAAGIS